MKVYPDYNRREGIFEFVLPEHVDETYHHMLIEIDDAEYSLYLEFKHQQCLWEQRIKKLHEGVLLNQDT